MTGAEALADGAGRLAAAGIERPRLEARLLLAHAAGLTTATLLRDLRQPVLAPGYANLIARRAAREPLAYLTGTREFWSLPFQVSPDTLIPRGDSETLVEAALAAHPAPGRVLDLGTGTGCLLLAVLHERRGAWGIGVDIAPAAARLAASNAARLGLAGRTAFLCADWAAPLDGQFDLVLSNPPYVAAPELPSLMPEVGMWEPRWALDGGEDGLDAYRTLAAILPGLLAPGGVAVLELGLEQAEAVASLALDNGMQVIGVRNDFAAVPRALVVARPDSHRHHGLASGATPHISGTRDTAV